MPIEKVRSSTGTDLCVRAGSTLRLDPGAYFFTGAGATINLLGGTPGTPSLILDGNASAIFYGLLNLAGEMDVASDGIVDCKLGSTWQSEGTVTFNGTSGNRTQVTVGQYATVTVNVGAIVNDGGTWNRTGPETKTGAGAVTTYAGGATIVGAVGDSSTVTRTGTTGYTALRVPLALPTTSTSVNPTDADLWYVPQNIGSDITVVLDAPADPTRFYKIVIMQPDPGYQVSDVTICTGTDAPAWQASHAYTIGDVVTHDSGNIYRCGVAGTSASSGGPTGTGTGISDGSGSLTWDALEVALIQFQHIVGKRPPSAYVEFVWNPLRHVWEWLRPADNSHFGNWINFF